MTPVCKSITKYAVIYEVGVASPSLPGLIFKLALGFLSTKKCDIFVFYCRVADGNTIACFAGSIR